MNIMEQRVYVGYRAVLDVQAAQAGRDHGDPQQVAEGGEKQ